MKKLSQNLSDCGVCAARIILLEDQSGFTRWTRGAKGAFCCPVPQPALS